MEGGLFKFILVADKNNSKKYEKEIAEIVNPNIIKITLPFR
jgi:hypothetical protein